MFSIDIDDSSVQSVLSALVSRVGNMQPVLQVIGEDIMERSKARFASSTGPDGQPWKPNARSTIEAYVASKGGFGKRGITKKGQALAMSKKPLIGHTGDLRRQFHVSATVNSVTVGNTTKWAAMQQFGGKKADFPHLWGNIPARPFLPIKQNGELYPEDRARILETLNAFLAGR